MSKSSGVNMRHLKLRVAGVVIILASPAAAMVAWAASAFFLPLWNYDGGGINWNLGSDQYLVADYAPGQPVRSRADGLICNTLADYDKSTFVHDEGHYYGVIADADPPRWVVKMKTFQPIVVSATGEGSSWVHVLMGKGYHFLSHVKHFGYGTANGAVMVYDGGDLMVASGASDVDEVLWEQVSQTQQIPYMHKETDSGTLVNYSVDEDGEYIYHEEELEIFAAGLVLVLKDDTDTVRLRHVPFQVDGGPLLGHNVWLELNMINSDAGKISGTVEAFNDGTIPPTSLLQTPDGTAAFE